jgi:hypothetical protein
MKNLLIILLGGTAVYLLYKSYKDSQTKIIVKQPEPEPVKEIPKSVTCPEGEILCSNNQSCYNPSAKYIVEPCS